MASVNKVILVGNLGCDPEVRYTSTGTAVANFSIATTDRWVDQQSGDKKERTEWHRIVVWGKQAEIANEYLRKGRQVFIEGSLQTREWTDRDGNTRYTTKIRAQRFQMLGTNPNKESNGKPVQTEEQGEPGNATKGKPAKAPKVTKTRKSTKRTEEPKAMKPSFAVADNPPPMNDDDIPF